MLLNFLDTCDALKNIVHFEGYYNSVIGIDQNQNWNFYKKNYFHHKRWPKFWKNN